MEIFRPDGTKLIFDEGEFVNKYKDDYFWGMENYLVSNLHRSSSYVEKEIEEILKKVKVNEPYSVRDVVRLLAWKIGKIDHKESEKESTEEIVAFRYIDGWKDVEKQMNSDEVFARLRSNKEDFPIGKIAYYLVSDMDNLKDLAKKDDPREFFETFCKRSFKGLGTVYIFTLLFFLSGGKYPIYDQFAHKAAKAIVLDKNPNDVFVGYSPSKTEIDKALSMYNEYRWLLSLIFGDESIERDQDRALWVYGHSKDKYSVI